MAVGKQMSLEGFTESSWMYMIWEESFSTS